MSVNQSRREIGSHISMLKLTLKTRLKPMKELISWKVC
jgi:hypothetical protein